MNAIDDASSIASTTAEELRSELEPFTSIDSEVAGIVDQALDEEEEEEDRETVLMREIVEEQAPTREAPVTRCR